MLSATRLAFDSQGNKMASHVAVSLQEMKELQCKLQLAFSSISKLTPHISPKAPNRNQHLQTIAQIKSIVNQKIPDNI